MKLVWNRNILILCIRTVTKKVTIWNFVKTSTILMLLLVIFKLITNSNMKIIVKKNALYFVSNPDLSNKIWALFNDKNKQQNNCWLPDRI